MRSSIVYHSFIIVRCIQFVHSTQTNPILSYTICYDPTALYTVYDELFCLIARAYVYRLGTVLRQLKWPNQDVGKHLKHTA